MCGLIEYADKQVIIVSRESKFIVGNPCDYHECRVKNT